jgi:hypothetical protein
MTERGQGQPGEQLKIEGVELTRDMVAAVMTGLKALDIRTWEQRGTRLYVPRDRQKKWELFGGKELTAPGEEKQARHELTQRIQQAAEVIAPLVGHRVRARTNHWCALGDEQAWEYVEEYTPKVFEGIVGETVFRGL